MSVIATSFYSFFMTLFQGKRLLLILFFLGSYAEIYAKKSKKNAVGSSEYRQEVANNIDKYIYKIYTRSGVALPKKIDDFTYARRTYLVLAGRIPTLKELKQFTKDENPKKRTVLVEKLLNQWGYQSQMINFYYDLFRVKETFNNKQTAAPYVRYIREAVQKNTAWDKLVKNLITAQGSVWHNGAVGYYIRDKGMELDNLANTTRLFTGTRIECAQCHDHPTKKIDRMDFFRLAAFGNGVREMNRKTFNETKKILFKNKKTPKKLRDFVINLERNLLYSSRVGKGIGRIKLPKDYQYRDADPHEFVGARTPFEKSVRMSHKRNGNNGIERFSNWLTINNKRFATTVANRLWQRTMGTGFYEPVDIYRELKPSANKQLIDYLANVMQEVNYDLKEFQHILMLTKTYQFKNQLSKYPIINRPIKRLSAEQIWDSFVTLQTGNPDKLPKRSFSNVIWVNHQILGNKEQGIEHIANLILKEKNPKKLLKSIKSLQQQAVEQTRQRKIKKKNKSPHVLKLSKPLKGIARASELRTPAPITHLLREFGQSDRELIENSSTEPNVNQLLAILNGHAEKVIVAQPKAYVHRAYTEADNIETAIDNLFLSTLTRLPSPKEKQLFIETVQQSPKNGYKNALSALLISAEFIFCQ